MSGTTYQPITNLPPTGSTTGGNVTATGGVMLPDWVNQAALNNFNNAMNLANTPYTAYPGQIIAPLSAIQNQGIAATQAAAGQAQPYFNQALTTAGNVGTTAAPIFSGAVSNLENLPQTTQSLLNPYLGSVESDTVSNIQRAAALQGQQIAAGAQQAGAYGGSRYGVEQATLDSETQRNIGQAINQIQSQGWNTASQLALNQAASMGQLAQAGGTLGLNTASTLANLGTGAQSAALQGAGALMGVGSAQQQQQQAELSAALTQWQQQQAWPYQQLAVAQGALAGSPYGTTTYSSQPYSTNPLANNLSTALSALPAAVGLGNQLFGSNGLFGDSNFGGANLTTSNITSPNAMSTAAAADPNLTFSLSNPVGTSVLPGGVGAYSAGGLSGLTNLAGGFADASNLGYSSFGGY